MKITNEGAAPPILNVTDMAGNPVLPAPGTEPDDPTDVALDSAATVPITPAASIAVVQSAVETEQVQASIDVTLTDAPIPGNILVAVQTTRSNKTPLGPGDGWTAHPDGTAIADPPSGTKTGMWWKVVEDGEAQTVHLTISAGDRHIAAVVEIEGATSLVDSAEIEDQHGTALSISATVDADEAIIIAAFGDAVSDAGSQSVTPDGSSTELVDQKASGSFNPLMWVAYRLIAAANAGTYAVAGTVSGSDRDWAGQVLAFKKTAGDVIWVDAPEVVDGDDATYDESTEADGLHIDLGGENILDSVRLLIGSETSGSKSYDLYGANESDYSDEVLVTAKTFTATGSFTPDEEIYTVTSGTGYRYWRFEGPTETRHWFTVEMFAAPAVITIDGYQVLSEKGEPDGYVPLDGDGLIPTEFLPPGSGVVGARFPIGFVVDGSGVAITADVQMEVPIIANGTLVSWVMSADQAGDAVVDVWLDDGASYPPTDADSITGGNEPELSGDDYATGTVSGWTTTTLAVGDVLVFHLDSAATIERLELTLIYERT